MHERPQRFHLKRTTSSFGGSPPRVFAVRLQTRALTTAVDSQALQSMPLCSLTPRHSHNLLRTSTIHGVRPGQAGAFSIKLNNFLTPFIIYGNWSRQSNQRRSWQPYCSPHRELKRRGLTWIRHMNTRELSGCMPTLSLE